MCKFPDEFTCNSGHCIDLDKRCDEQKDCLDGADEERCDLLSIPSSYNRANAPRAPIEKDSLEIEINIYVVTIDSIETAEGFRALLVTLDTVLAVLANPFAKLGEIKT